jgi:hypothetical protein
VLFHASALAADSPGVVVLVSSRESHDYYEKQHTSVLGHRPLIDRTDKTWNTEEIGHMLCFPCLMSALQFACGVKSDTGSRNLGLGHLEASDSEEVDIPWLAR